MERGMGRRLPPLNAVRAFEAAARRMSFLKAAEELHVTAGAVSQQVKHLEDWLGVALFRRLPRGVTLTDAGQRYWPELADLLDRLADLSQRVRAEEESPVLTVTTLPSFAARWLIPRLGRLRALHPEMEVHVLASTAVADFSRDGVDVAIRYGRGVYPGLRCDLLLDDAVFPVCGPRLLEGPHPLKKLRDLRHHTLLHDDLDPGGLPEVTWASWLMEAGVRDVDPHRGLRFAFTHMTLQAAVAGQGVALAPAGLVADDLAQGLLVRPFALAVPALYSYYVVSPEDTADRPKVAAFRCWLLAEAGRGLLAESGRGAFGRDRPGG